MDIEAALASETDADFGKLSAGPPAAENSLLTLLRQTFCSDEELADQLQSGNADALAVLFKRYGPVLFGIARRILRSDSEAEDAYNRYFWTCSVSSIDSIQKREILKHGF